MTYMISVIDLKKPIIREDILVDKGIIELSDREGLGILVEQLLDQITEKRGEHRK